MNAIMEESKGKKAKLEAGVSDISKRLKLLRKRLGFSQVEMAEKLGVYQSTVAFYENGSREITLDVIKLINSRLGINYAWLLNGEGKFDDKAGNLDNISELEAANLFLEKRVNDLHKKLIALTREVMAIKHPKT